MPGTRESNPLMKGRKQPNKDWFRIENAHQDEDNASDALTKVYIYGDIGDSWFSDSTSANDFVKLLSGIKSDKIELHLNSGGGSAFDGIAIYNALVQHDAEVEVHVDALAASAASIVAMAADNLFMTTGSMMMIHDASMGAYGNADFLRDSADILDKLSNSGANIYAKKAGESPDFWRSLMRQEVWYDADEAVEAGLADGISGTTEEDDMKAAEQYFDRMPYQYAGRDKAPSPRELRLKVEQLLGEKMTQPTPAAPPPPAPAASEGEPEPTGDPVDPNRQDEEVEPTPAEPAPAAPSTPPPGEPSQFVPTQSTSGRFTFMVDGQPTTDPNVVQNRISVLEQFRQETMTNARNTFVDQLASDKKILQPQVAKLKEYALSLDDKGYAAWTATWEGAAALPMLSGHGGSEDPDAPPTSSAKANDLEIAKDTLKQHMLGGMKEEQLKKTSSYAKVIAAEPDFTFDSLPKY